MSTPSCHPQDDNDGIQGVDMSKILRTLVMAVATTGMWAVSSSSQATPAYARQVGVECSACHFQKYPALNSFGRSFKANGYTLMGSQGKVEGEQLSLPDTLNASLYFKIRYQQTNGVEIAGERTTNSGELQFPDEAVLLIGGRVSENIGFMFEGQMADPSASLLAGFKLPVTFDVAGLKGSVIPYTTDALGSAYGFEVLSTGAVRNIRVNEHRKEISAAQYLGTATAAEGLAFVLYDPMWHVNLTKWSPNHAATANGQQAAAPTATYMRAAVTPNWGGWDVGMGIQSWMGAAQESVDPACAPAPCSPTPNNEFKTEAFVVDAQVQGEAFGMPLGVYFSHGAAKATSAGGVKNLFNSRARDKQATTITGELGVSHSPHITLLAAYRQGDNGKTAGSEEDNALTFGANYRLAQNVGLHFIYSKYSGNAYNGATSTPGEAGNELATLMLSAGF